MESQKTYASTPQQPQAYVCTYFTREGEKKFVGSVSQLVVSPTTQHNVCKHKKCIEGRRTLSFENWEEFLSFLKNPAMDCWLPTLSHENISVTSCGKKTGIPSKYYLDFCKIINEREERILNPPPPPPSAPVWNIDDTGCVVFNKDSQLGTCTDTSPSATDFVGFKDDFVKSENNSEGGDSKVGGQVEDEEEESEEDESTQEVLIHQKHKNTVTNGSHSCDSTKENSVSERNNIDDNISQQEKYKDGDYIKKFLGHILDHTSERTLDDFEEDSKDHTDCGIM